MKNSDSFLKNLSVTVRNHRKKGGLNQQKLAKLAGVGKSAVFDLEHEKKTIQLDTLLKILYVLNISMTLSSPLMKSVSPKDESK